MVSWKAMSLDSDKNPKCESCGRVDIDQLFRKVFRRIVCKKCKEEKPEKYSLLTKTECKDASIFLYFYCLVINLSSTALTGLFTNRSYVPLCLSVLVQTP